MAEKNDKTDRTSNTASYPKIPMEGTFATNLNNPCLHTRVSGQLRDRGQADPHVEAAYPEPRFSNVLVPAPAPLCDSGTNDWKQRDPGPSGQQPHNVSHIQQLVTTSLSSAVNKGQYLGISVGTGTSRGHHTCLR